MIFNRRGDIFDEFEREFEEMNRMMDRMFASMRGKDWSQVPPDHPLYYGVSVNVGPDGVPRVQEFGNVRSEGRDVLESGVREPFVTSFLDEEHDQVRITAEMPGVDKERVKVQIAGDTLTLRAQGDDRTYEKTLRLGVPVKEDSAKARYNNGVLEVTVDLKAPVKPKGREVKVE